MIPKVIHMCWLSSDPYPESIRRCVDTWHKYLPDYEIKVWNFDVFPRGKSPWVDQAFDNKKYAFAADYIRNYALYHEGGIYLDSDVEVLKSFNELIKLPYFFGFENGSGRIDAGIMASEPHHPLFKAMLDYYEAKGDFVNPDGSFNCTPLPWIIMDQLNDMGYEVKEIDNPSEFCNDDKVLSVFPFDYFSPIHFKSCAVESTPRTIAIHRFVGSWATGKHKYSKIIKRILGPRLSLAYINLKSFIKGEK